MKSIFKWVQLSDIHFQNKNAGFNSELLRESLPNYLEENVKDCKALILTGDYRFAPDREENPKRVANYILTISNKLHVEGRVYAVPGNHDLDRSKSRLFLIQGVQSEYTPEMGTIDSKVCSDLLGGFSFFHELCTELNIPSINNSENPHLFVSLENCNLLLLNTALTAGCDEDASRLILGSKYIRALVERSENNKKPIIAVGHHSLYTLNEKEKDTLSTMFDRNGIRLYLCGHSHKHKYESFGEYGKEVTVGCLKEDDTSVTASFAVGELFDDGSVQITSYYWDTSEQGWYEMPSKKREWAGLYQLAKPEFNEETLPERVEQQYNPLSLVGYSLLGSLGEEGIKYYWKKDGSLVESIAFNRRLKNPIRDEDNNTSAYTISTSIGCQLSATNNECLFCETGTSKFAAPLSGEDIALQSIFMAEYDSDCPSFPSVRGHAREFAFMGQGEPGYNYPAIQKAIILNDFIMERLGQKVSRYIISTCGITDLIPSVIQDIKKGIFKNRVTIHLSLHDVGDDRKDLMPISRTNDYSEILSQCKILYNYTKEKIGVGILLLDKFQPANSQRYYTLTPDKLRTILGELDNEAFRIDLCAVNSTKAGKQLHQMSNEYANILLGIVKDAGFEGKIFTSFGSAQNAGCGMLSSTYENIQPLGNGSIRHFNKAVDLLKEAREYYKKTL